MCAHTCMCLYSKISHFSSLIDRRLTGTLEVFLQLFLLLITGFLSADAKELPGNAGLFDMALALEWIRDYIRFFGGTPNKVTVFGQGTGASSAVLLSLSQITQGSTEAVGCC